jgi:hypothetical protein
VSSIGAELKQAVNRDVERHSNAFTANKKARKTFFITKLSHFYGSEVLDRLLKIIKHQHHGHPIDRLHPKAGERVAIASEEGDDDFTFVSSSSIIPRHLARGCSALHLN